MRFLYKYVIRPGEEVHVRGPAAAVPETGIEGLDEVHVFFRGSAVYVTGVGDKDPMEALAGDAKGKKLVDTLRTYASYQPDHPMRGRLDLRRTPGIREDARAEARGEVTA